MTTPVYYVYLTASPATIVSIGNSVDAAGLGYANSTTCTTASGQPPSNSQVASQSPQGTGSPTAGNGAPATTTTTTPTSSIPVLGPVLTPVTSPITGALGLNKTTTT